MKKIEVKEKLVQALNGYVCITEEILEDLPELANNEGVIAFCTEEGYNFAQECIEFCAKMGKEFNLKKEIEEIVKKLIQDYELVKEEIKEETFSSKESKESKLEEFKI